MTSTSEKIIVYGHPTCPMIPPVLGLLSQTDAGYEYINIRRDSAAAERVREINKGYESVPTLIFPDGSTLTEPSVRQLQQKLASMGHRVPLQAVLLGNAHLLVTGGIVLFALLRFLEVI